MSLRTLAGAVVTAFLSGVARLAANLAPARADIPVPVRVDRRPPPPRA